MRNYTTKLEQLIKKYPEKWEKKMYDKNAFLVEVGNPRTHNYYIESGIIKAYVFNEEINDETIINFFSEGDFIMSYAIVPNEIKNAVLNLEVVKDAVIRRITIKDWFDIRNKEPIIVTKILQECLDMVINRLIFNGKINALPRAESRYRKMLEVFPFLIALKDNDVAKIMGVDPRTITNIKHNNKKIAIPKVFF